MRPNDNIIHAIDLLRDIAIELEPRDIPVRYIAAACHIDEYGMENVVIGDELDDLLAGRPPFENIRYINVILDLRSIAVDVSSDISHLFARLQARFQNGEF